MGLKKCSYFAMNYALLNTYVISKAVNSADFLVLLPEGLLNDIRSLEGVEGDDVTLLLLPC